MIAKHKANMKSFKVTRLVNNVYAPRMNAKFLSPFLYKSALKESRSERSFSNSADTANQVILGLNSDGGASQAALVNSDGKVIYENEAKAEVRDGMRQP